MLQPHLFGGLLHRDDCYNKLMEVGRASALSYALSHEELRSEIRLSDLTDADDEIVTEPSLPNAFDS